MITNRKDLKSAVDMAEFLRLTEKEAKKSISHIQKTIRENWEAEADEQNIIHKEKTLMRQAFEEGPRPRWYARMYTWLR